MSDELDPNIPAELQYQSRLMQELMKNPKTRGGLLQLVKTHAPDVRIPELDTVNEVVSVVRPEIEALRKEREEARKEREAERAERERAKVLARHDLGLTDEDLPAITELMEKRGISNFETAAEFRANAKRAATPRTVVPSPFTMPTEDSGYIKKLLKGDKKAHLEKAYEVAEELAQARR